MVGVQRGVVLHLVQLGDGLRCRGEAGIARDVGDAVAVDPDLPVIAQGFEIGGAGADGHGRLPVMKLSKAKLSQVKNTSSP